MRWLILVLVILIVGGLWALSFFFPEVRPFAEALTAGVVLPPVAILIFLWLRARAKKESEAAGPEAKKPRVAPAVASARKDVRQALFELARMRGGRRAAAKLPWYVALGASGAGRSDLLDRAGFSLVSLQSPRVRGEVAAPVFDLRCSSEAVVLDPPSSVLAPAATESWVALLDELHRARPARTLEGILLAVSIPALLASGEQERRELAGQLRQALDALLHRLGMALPVYILLTKADALPGFSEFWADDPKRQEATWGASFASDDDRAEHEPAKAVTRELATLGSALHARMLDRIAVETDPARKTRVLGFPREVLKVGAPLAEFVELLCARGALSERFLLRGFYLTSSDTRGFSPQAGGAARGSFVVDVFRSVILPDRNLGTVTATALRKRSRFDQRAAFIALAACFVFFVPALLSFASNAALAHTVQAAAEGLADRKAVTLPGTRGDALEDALDALQTVEGQAGDLAIPEWFGPRAARELHEPLENAYLQRIHRWLLAQLKPALEKELDGIVWGPPLTDSAAAPDGRTPLREAYDVLRLYATMTSPAGHADKAHEAHEEWAATHLAGAWRRLLPEAEAVAPARLTEHAHRYLAALVRHPELAWAAGEPIAHVRRRMRELHTNELPYRRLLLWAADQPAVSAKALFGATSLNFLDGPGSSVPGAFTLSGWQKIRDALAAPASWPDEAIIEPWVLGDSGTSPNDPATLRDKYFADYTDRWMRFLNGVRVRTPQDVAAAKDELTAFQSEGFYKALFAEFKDNVIHSEPPPPEPTSPASLVSRLPWPGKTEVDAGSGPLPPSPVEKSFQPVLAFAGELEGVKNPSPAPLDKYIAILDKLKATLDAAPTPKQSLQDLKAPFVEARIGVGELLDGTSEPLRSTLSRLLLPPVTGSVSAVRAEGAGSLAKDWRSDVWTVWDQKLSQRFPFHGGEAANFADFAAFFKPDGVLWGFVTAHLADSVERKGDGHYVPKQGADPMTPDGLECLTVAQEITDAFFQGATPGMLLSVQADWTDPDVKDAKFVVGSKETLLPQAQWSSPFGWFGEDVRVEWQQGGRPTQEFGRHSFSLFDLFGHLGGLRPSPLGHSIYTVECPPLTLKVRPDGRVDPLRADFFTRLRCPPEMRMEAQPQ